MENARQKNNIELLEDLKKAAVENHVKRLDNEFLKRFLVGHQYDTITALKSVQNFESFVARRRQEWLELKKAWVEKLLKFQIVDILEKRGVQGQTIVWIRLDNWDPQYVSADEILQISGLVCELLYVEQKDIECIDVILDLHKLSMRHLQKLSTAFAKRMIFFMTACLPMSLLHIYIVRQPTIFYLVYALFKPFLDENLKKAIKICGSNFECLLDTIGKENVPIELDGLCENSDPNRWLNLFYNRNAQEDLERAGYKFE